MAGTSPAMTLPRLPEFRHHLGRNRRGGDRVGIVLAAHGPDARLAAFDRDLASVDYLVLDIEARTAEFRHARDHLDGVAEGDRLHEVAARVDQGDADDAVGFGEVGLINAKGGFEQAPAIGVEELEEARVED